MEFTLKDLANLFGQIIDREDEKAHGQITSISDKYSHPKGIHSNQSRNIFQLFKLLQFVIIWGILFSIKTNKTRKQHLLEYYHEWKAVFAFRATSHLNVKHEQPLIMTHSFCFENIMLFTKTRQRRSIEVFKLKFGIISSMKVISTCASTVERMRLLAVSGRFWKL